MPASSENQTNTRPRSIFRPIFWSIVTITALPIVAVAGINIVHGDDPRPCAAMGNMVVAAALAEAGGPRNPYSPDLAVMAVPMLREMAHATVMQAGPLRCQLGVLRVALGLDGAFAAIQPPREPSVEELLRPPAPYREASPSAPTPAPTATPIPPTSAPMPLVVEPSARVSEPVPIRPPQSTR